MANRVNVEISANVQGFEQGMDKATESAKRYETETRKISENTVNFNKQFREAKKAVKELAAGYAQLSKEEKNSGFGREMAKQLQAAKEKAAELIDMQGDLNQELKNMASDTRLLDTMSEGFGVIADTAATAMGVIAQFTGREEDAKKAVVAFTTAQSALGAVTKVANMLQGQSNTMLAINKIQNLAAAAAEKIRTAAQEKGVVATKSATVAQAALNLVAKANPYVLLATAVIAVGAAMIAFAMKANKAEDATKKLNKEMHATSIQARKDAQDDIVKLDILYKATQNTKLSIDERRKAAEKLQALYPAYFGNMSKEQIMLGESSRLYQQLKNDIIAVAMAKAYEQKIADIAKEKVDLEDQLESQQEITKELDKQAKAANQASKNRPMISNGSSVPGDLQGQININRAVVQSREEEKKLTDQINEKTEAQQKYLDKINKTIPAQERLTKNDELIKDNKNPAGSSKSGGSGSGSTEIKPVVGSIEELENEISNLQSLAKKGALPKELQDPVAYANKIKQLQAALKELKIKWGFEEPEKAKTKLEQLQDKLTAAQKAYVIAVDTDDKQAQQAALNAYYAAQKELDDYQLKIKIEPIQDPQKAAQEKAEIQKIVSDAFNTDEGPSFDFSGLDEDVREEADEILKQFERVYDAREELTKIMNDPNASDAMISAAQDGLDQLKVTFDELSEKVDFFQGWADAIEESQKKTEKLSKTMKGVGDAVSAAGDLFSALGDAAEDEGTAALGIVAKAVATVALSFAQALTTCKTWYEWVAFGITGLATMVSMISQIKSTTSGYAEGGIVGGSSYHGDNMLIRVNSGEGIINQRQQKRLFDILNGNALPGNVNNNIEVSGVIRGTDLLIVGRNANKKLAKANSNISLNMK